MKLYSIASGSSGNCIYVGSDTTNLLIDTGISMKRINNGLSEIDINLDSIQGILVTHEHSDHISALGCIARKYNIPIYSTYETANAIRNKKTIGDISEDLFKYIKPDEPFLINDISVEPFSTSHDACNPVCYTVQADGKKVGVATDMGMYDDYIISKLKDADLLMVEANHDVNMLMVGKYPYFLKQRILGNRGHLSNDTSANLIIRLLNHKLRYVLLAHLSKENNYEELAYETVCCELSSRGCDYSLLNLSVAHRECPSQMVIL